MARPATAPGSSAAGGVEGSAGGVAASGGDAGQEPSGGPSGQADRAEADRGPPPEHLGGTRHGGIDGLGHGLHDGHGPPG